MSDGWQRVVAAGYAYEIAGLIYYIVVLVGTRREKFTRHTRALMLATALALVVSGLVHAQVLSLLGLLACVLAIVSPISYLLDMRKAAR